MEYFIYTLSDPISNEIRYVGKTKDLKDRLRRHMSNYNLKATWTSKNKWLKNLKNNNLKPIMEILDQGDENNIDDLEIYWIGQLKAWGIKIKNETDGGEGFDWTDKKHKDETIQKMKIIHKLNSHQKGEKNSQYQTCWVYNKDIKKNKKINNKDINDWISIGWIKGRKMKFK